MRTTVITISEYAALYGCTPRNVSKNITSGKLMPFMLGFKKSGGAYLLEVDLKWYQGKTEPQLPSGMVCHHTFQDLKGDGYFYCGVCGSKVGDF